MSGEHKITPQRCVGEEQVIVGAQTLHGTGFHVGLEALAVHLMQVIGGIHEKAASLGKVAIQAIAVDILKLVAHPERITGVITLDVVRRGPIAPVERDHQAADFWGVSISAIKISVRIIENGTLIIAQRFKRHFFSRTVSRPIPPRLQIRSIQPFVHPLAQPGFHRLIRRPGVVHAMQENHHPRQVSGYFHFAHGVAIGHQPGRELRHAVHVFVAHWLPPFGPLPRIAVVCVRCILSLSISPLEYFSPCTVLPPSRSICYVRGDDR
ncbi:hypothetical protein D3C86_1398020 [compost metagenome]